MFEPGDPVECVRGGDWHVRAPRWMVWARMCRARWPGPTKGDRDRVIETGMAEHPETGRALIMLRVTGWRGFWFNSECFRKIQRRDIQAWLETADSTEGPVRQKEAA